MTTWSIDASFVVDLPDGSIAGMVDIAQLGARPEPSQDPTLYNANYT